MSAVFRRLALRLWHSRSGRAGLFVLAAIALLALLAPPFLPDPTATPDPVNGALLPPSWAHPFGTDHLSRDILARVATGARVSLGIAVCSIVLSAIVGALVGLVAGVWGGAVDTALMYLVNGTLAVPRLLILLLFLAAAERLPLTVLVLVIGGTGWLTTSRFVRSETRRVKHEKYVQAGYALGGGRRHVIFRHILPNVAGPLIVDATLGVGDVILIEAGLSYLGLGVRPPTPSWGGMILDGRDFVAPAPWTSLFPGLAVVITVLAVTLVGDALRDPPGGAQDEAQDSGGA